MTKRKVEIVTPVHNRRQETLQFLKSISHLDSTGLELHVIVVDDGSADGTSDAIRRQYPETEIVVGDGNLWYTAGVNRGIEAALKHGPDYILAVNNDSIFDEMCVVNLVACAERHPHSIVGGLLLDWETPHKIFQVSPKWELLRGGYRHWLKQTVWTVPQRPWQVEMIVGNCILFPAEAIREAGLMDEKHLPQFGDAEYTPRMRRLGWRLLMEPRARLFCKPNDVIVGFRRLSIREKLDQLFLKPTGPYSVKRRFYASLGGAPSKFHGLLAVPIFYARVLFGISQEGKWAMSQREEPLAVTFASEVVDE